MALIKDQHMRAAMWGLFFLGLAHVNFSTTRKQRCYTIYKYLVFVFFVTFHITQIVAVPIAFNQKNYAHVIDNLSVSLLYISSIVKFVTLMNMKIKSLVRHVRQVENIIIDGNDDEMKKIFDKHRRYNENLSILILMLGVVTIALWFMNPGLNYLGWKYLSVHEDGEKYQLPLIFGSWFPFDWTQHYWLAYFIQFMGGTFGASITVAPDAILWSFMTFVMMNLDVLEYKIHAVPKHVKETMQFNPWMSEKYAIRVVCNKCIQLHQNIISFVETLDNAMNILMLIDFFGCSLQIGATILRVLIFGDDLIMMISAAQYLLAIVTQMLLFYWHANEIIVASLTISTAIFTSEWYNYDEDIKKDLQFLMLRSQKPLLLNIGPFFYMSTSAAISILRAAYSYTALIRHVY